MAVFEWCQNLRLRHGDAFSADGYLLYKYRGTDPSHPDHLGLRAAGVRNIPLVYFHGLLPGKYLATWPVFIRGDDPRALQFSVSVDDRLLTADQIAGDPETAIRRRYATSLVLRARGATSEARAALSELCEAYYQPVFRFLQREGRNDDAARELTQQFFARILQRGGVGDADPARGRFRSYLLGAVKHFLADQRFRDRLRAELTQTLTEGDDVAAELRYLVEVLNQE